MATPHSLECAKSNFRYPLINPPPELFDRMRGTGWAPVINSPPPNSGHYVIEPTLDFAHFWLGGVATGIRVLGINLVQQTTFGLPKTCLPQFGDTE